MPNRQSSLISNPFTLPADPGPSPLDVSSPAPVRRDSLIGDPRSSDRLTDAARRAPAMPPDRAVGVLRLQRQTGLPTEVIDRNLEDVERQASAQDFDVDRFRAESPLLSQWLAAHPAHLALTNDDLRPLSGIERALDVARNVVGAAGAGVMEFSRGTWGLIQAASETAGAQDLSTFARGSASVAGSLATRSRGTQARAGFVERSIYSGVESVGQMAPGLVAGLVLGPEALLASAGLTTGGQAY